MLTRRSGLGGRSFLGDARAALGVAQAWGAAGLVAALTIGGAFVVNADMFDERLHRTTQQSVDELALGLAFGSVVGFVESGADGPRIVRLRLDVRAADGADTVDLRNIVVHAVDKARLVTLSYGNGSANVSKSFQAEASLDPDGSVGQGTIGRGDVAHLVFDVGSEDQSLAPRETLSLRFQSGTGPTMEVDVHAPATFAAAKILTLEREVRRGE